VTVIESREPGRSADRPGWAPFTLVAFVALVAATNIAGIAWARLLESSPAQLLALSSRNRYLALALGADVGEVAYWVIGSARIAVAFVVLHLIGRAYHATALNWFTRYLGVDAEALDGFRRAYERAEWVVIPVFVGSNLVAAISGVQHTRWPRLVLLMTIGIIGRLALIRWLAVVFEEQLTDVVGLIQRYSWWAVGISVVLVLLVNLRNLRGGAAR
jgi:hypothetical protein